MRGIVAVVFSLAMAASAQASSIVVLGEAASADPSVVTAGNASAKGPSVKTTTTGAATANSSVVVLGQPADGAATAARKPARSGGVVVIRAGVVGSASTTPIAPVVPAATTATAADAPADNSGTGGKVPTLRDAMTQNGRAPALAQ